MPQVYIKRNFQIRPKTKLSSVQSTVPPTHPPNPPSPQVDSSTLHQQRSRKSTPDITPRSWETAKRNPEISGKEIPLLRNIWKRKTCLSRRLALAKRSQKYFFCSFCMFSYYSLFLHLPVAFRQQIKVRKSLKLMFRGKVVCNRHHTLYIRGCPYIT